MYDMHLKYYGLEKEPFHITPDPEFLYLSPSHKEALGAIIYGVENRTGFMMITGGVGLGKTTILRAAMQEFDNEHILAVLVFNPCISYCALLRLIYDDLGLELPDTNDQFEVVHRLHLALIEEYKRGNNVVLIIDEAQNMPVETLEQLRMLSNLESNKEKLIQIILVGQQPELENLLNTEALRQLKQRISHKATLVKLTGEESIDYIKHRLAIASTAKGSPFTKSALKVIVKHCDGVPRCINNICNNALISGFGLSQKPIKPSLVQEIIRDLDGSPKRRWKPWLIAPVGLILIALFGLLFYPTDGLFSFRTHLDQKISTSAPVILVPQLTAEKHEAETLKSSQSKPTDAVVVTDMDGSKPVSPVTAPVPKPEGTLPKVEAASAMPSREPVPKPIVPTTVEPEPPPQRGLPTQTAPPAIAQPKNEVPKPVSASAGEVPVQKFIKEPVGATSQALPDMKADLPGTTPPAAPQAVASDSQRSPDPSEIIDWLIKNRNTKSSSSN